MDTAYIVLLWCSLSTFFDFLEILFSVKVSNLSFGTIEAISQFESYNISYTQCTAILYNLQHSTLGFIFENENVCTLTTYKQKWQKEFLNAPFPKYLPFIHNSSNKLLINFKEKDRPKMLSSFGLGNDSSKCFILGFSGIGNRGIWTAAAARGLAAQFFDNKVPLRWDVVAGISSGGLNALISSYFIPGGKEQINKNSKILNVMQNSTYTNLKSSYIIKDSNIRSDNYICSSGDNKEFIFEIWIGLGNPKSRSNVKCYSPIKPSDEYSNEVYHINTSNDHFFENEMNYTNYLYDMYLKANSEVINNNCIVPISQDSSRWWQVLIPTVTKIGKYITSFCTQDGWRSFVLGSLRNLYSVKREALISASRIVDGTLVTWSMQSILAQILGIKLKDINNKSETSWVLMDYENSKKLADIVLASNAVSGIYMPVEIDDNYYIWGGLRGEANLEAAIERCMEIKPNIKEEDIVIDFITGAYYREELFHAGSYNDILGKEGFFGKLKRRFQNLNKDSDCRPDPPTLFELLNRAWEFVTSPIRGLYPLETVIRRYPRVKFRFILRPKTLRFFPKSSFMFPHHKQKMLILMDGFYTGRNATIYDFSINDTTVSM
ncbi:uncharacterized protein CMU_005750 [Cryptosporidium muris RN66]|uniref:Uncharacterized protein n=1 Tax=Cryptosporidium muris (strain RN66) TaxID=441375 RepID=B6AHF7_CRYMR|nr:uncharacterized protein CMU_005750 [Cryptosporidium muris RN66]EEA07652.1 hypothetical protein, conserved [Cryptosporidium muris RN66]|eukprot:XP_002142001.1 hypothetical protein [Cryptosporidium muris RN66]